MTIQQKSANMKLVSIKKTYHFRRQSTVTFKWDPRLVSLLYIMPDKYRNYSNNALMVNQIAIISKICWLENVLRIHLCATDYSCYFDWHSRNVLQLFLTSDELSCLVSQDTRSVTERSLPSQNYSMWSFC